MPYIKTNFQKFPQCLQMKFEKGHKGIGNVFREGHKVIGGFQKNHIGCGKLFVPGHKACNHKEIGYEKIRHDGYVMVKVAHPSKYRPKQDVIWESIYGPMPKRSLVIFLNGDKNDFDIKNLVCINRKELGRIRGKKYYIAPLEVRPSIVALARLEAKLEDL